MLRPLLRRHLRLFFFAMWLTAIPVGGAWAAQFADHGNVEDDVELSQQRAQWYELVAGETSSSQSTVDNRLARDLQPLLNDADALADFRGTSNRYGGITDAIGFDPFNGAGQNCQECGPLDFEVQQDLLDIGDGNIDAVVERTVLPEAESGYTVTPWGWSVPTSLIVWWATMGPLSLWLAHQQVRTDGYEKRSFASWPWQQPSPERSVLMVTAAPLVLPYVFTRRATKRRFQETLQEKFPEQMSLVAQTDRLLETTTGDKAVELRSMRNEVMAELEAQARTDGSLDDIELRVLTESLREAKEDLAIRASALREVNEITSSRGEP